MRIFLSIFILLTSLYAKEQKSCYTIQLLSVPITTQNKTLFDKHSYPQECISMDIANKITLRCGCYEDFQTAQEQLPHYKEKFKDAYIATSYKFRFESQPIIQQTKQTEVKDEELKLMLQSFLYTNDLQNAYKTAYLGYKKNPKSYYWNQKMAEISKWTGRRQEAIKYLKFMYFQTHDPKLEKKIIDYGLEDYQFEEIAPFVRSETKKNPSKENIEKMVYVYTQLGEPQKATEVLHSFYKKNPQKVEYLTQELQIYMDMGELKSAHKIIQEIEQKHLFTKNNVKLISYYYYLQREIEKSYKVLQTVAYKNEYDQKLYQLQSDLGWYLQKYLKAAQTSRVLIDKNDGRLVDYERVIYAYQTKDSKLAMHTALKAYEKFHLSYLFYTFAQSTIKHKDYTILMQTIKKIDTADSRITKEANYWLVKAEVYEHVNKKEAAIQALHRALQLSHNSIQVALTAIDLFLKLDLYDEASLVLQDITKQKELSPALYFIIASMYNTLHDIDRASFYTDKLIYANDAITQTIEFKFLQMELYQAQFREGAAKTKIKEILALLHKEAQENPNIISTDRYLHDYLRAQLYIMPADEFEKALKRAKKHLTKAHYDDIAYAWATKNGAWGKAHKIYLQTKNKAIWLQLSNALAQQEHTQIENLLLLHLASAPKDDAAYAAQNDGQISLKQSLAYDSLDTNNYNQTAYINMLNLTKERSDLLSSKLSYYKRDPLLQKYFEAKNSLYIDNGLYFLTHFDYYLNSTINENILLNPPHNSLSLDIGIKKEFDRGNFILTCGYANSMRSYNFFKAQGEYILNRYFTLSTSISKNIKAPDESTQLLLGGKKDVLSFGVLYNILNSTTLEIRYSRNFYSSQDGTDIGDSHYLSAILSYQIRNGYPDMRVGVFGDYAIYNENNSSKGVIDKLQDGAFNVLPGDFYNIGVNFSYGMQNSRIYTRVWRPYFEVNTFYNSELNVFSYGFSGGFGGKVYTQDHLVLGIDYTSDVSGIGGSIFELFLRYEFLYTH